MMKEGSANPSTQLKEEEDPPPPPASSSLSVSQKENPPSYMSYLDSAGSLPAAAPVDDIMPMPPADNNNNFNRRIPRHQRLRPGAYSSAGPGTSVLERMQTLSRRLVGLRIPTMESLPKLQDSSDDDDAGVKANDLDETDPSWGGGSGIVLARMRTSQLAVATMVEEEEEGFDHHNRIHPAAARAVSERAVLQQQRKKAEEERRRKRTTNLYAGALLLVLVAILVTIVAVPHSGPKSTTTITTDHPNKEVLPSSTSSPSAAGSASPTTPLPPMENLELLYDDLPQRTKESLLYDIDSPQYMAWTWLIEHPNITDYPEWRKKQIFAMATFFYSFEGPNWPEDSPVHGRWMDVNASECSWVLTDGEVAFWAKSSADYFGPAAYNRQDFQPCNEIGQLQTLILWQLFIPTHLKPFIPPEIEFLTSLKILAVMYSGSQINTKLSDDLLVPEVINLPRLELLNFYASGASGTIPTSALTKMTGLRHLVLGANRLVGTIPIEIASMVSLEYIGLSRMEGIIGQIPSELGLLTSMTEMWVQRSALTGSIPSELGLMSDLIELQIGSNALTGPIPSQLGLMTNMVHFRLGNDFTLHRNDFSGSLPRELWDLSHMETLSLPSLPNLHGKVPARIFMPNLTVFSLSGSPQFSGTIPEQLCTIPELEVDCSDLLCGCHCPCIATFNQTNLLHWNKSVPP